MNIFVTKLSFETGNEELREAFEPYGEVVSVNIIRDKNSGRSKGFGFVEMTNDEEAKSAISELNDTEMQGRTIVVKVAEPRRDKDQRR